MPKPKPTLPCLLLATLCLTAAPGGYAAAQVTVDLHALDGLSNAPANPAPAPAEPAPEHKPPPHRVRPRHTVARPAKPATKPAEEHAAKPAAPAPAAAVPPPSKPVATAAPTVPAPAPPAAVIGPAPPPPVVIPPPAPADAPMPPPPPPAISATAGTVAATLPAKDGTGVRLDFASGQSDLTPSSADAVKALVQAAPKADTTSFNVMAYAAGVPEDPSTARRLSLSRALSVRSVLMSYGVPSTHIYVRALGAQAGDGPSDRVDVTVLGANAVSPPPGSSPSGSPSGSPPGSPPGGAATRTP